MDTPLSGTSADQPAKIEELPHKRALMVLAQGFEDSEAVCVLDIMGWTGYRPTIATVSVDIAGFHDSVRGAFGTLLATDLLIDDAAASDYDALVIPGGFHNRGFDEIYDERIRKLVRAMRDKQAPIATMCVGVLPVAESGVLVGGKASTYALSSRHDNLGRLSELGCEPVREPLVEWDGVVSCSGPAFSEAVVYRLLEMLVGTEAAAEIRRYREGLA